MHMGSNNIQNQVHPPRPKHREVDLNIRKRIYCKAGNSSMLLAKNVAVPAAKVFINSIRENAKKLGINIELNMIITQ
jgi:hypothetical protein